MLAVQVPAQTDDVKFVLSDLRNAIGMHDEGAEEVVVVRALPLDLRMLIGRELFNVSK